MDSDAQVVPNIDWRVDDLRVALEQAIELLDAGELRSLTIAAVLNVKDSHPLDYQVITLMSGRWEGDVWLLKGATARLQERLGQHLDDTQIVSDEA